MRPGRVPAHPHHQVIVPDQLTPAVPDDVRMFFTAVTHAGGLPPCTDRLDTQDPRKVIKFHFPGTGVALSVTGACDALHAFLPLSESDTHGFLPNLGRPLRKYVGHGGIRFDPSLCRTLAVPCLPRGFMRTVPRPLNLLPARDKLPPPAHGGSGMAGIFLPRRAF